uniref:Uncharacterized protein n=1 Tax=Anguilla anguilla TaxID=7936 RepID=A0A0E9VXR9_ANGAN
MCVNCILSVPACGQSCVGKHTAL